MFRLFSLLIGLVFGCIPLLPAGGDAPASSRLALYRKYRPLLTEAGLTAAGCALCRLLFRQSGALAVLWAGLGVLLGRLAPFHGHGEGGAVSVYTFEIFFAPVWGILSCAAGVGVSVLTGYEVLGALLPTALFALPADLFYGAEAGAVAVAAALLLAFRRRQDLIFLIEGDEPGIAADDEEE